MRYLRQNIVLVGAMALVALMVWASAYLNSWSYGIIAGSRPDFMRRTLTMVECYADKECYEATFAADGMVLREHVQADLVCASEGAIDWISEFDATTTEGMSAFVAYLDELMLTAPAIGLHFEQHGRAIGLMKFSLGRSNGVEVTIRMEEGNGHLQIVRIDGLCEALKLVSEWRKNC